MSSMSESAELLISFLPDVEGITANTWDGVEAIPGAEEHRDPHSRGWKNEEDSSGKFSLESRAHPSKSTLIQTSVKRLKSAKPILTANSEIYPTNTANTQMTMTKGADLKRSCVVCQDDVETLVFVLDCANRNNAILFDERKVFIVSKRYMKRIREK